MKGIFTFLRISVLAFIFISSSYATGLLTEDFSYTAGDLLTDHGWAVSSGTGGISVTSPGLTYSGYLGSGIGLAATVNNVTSEDDNLPFTPTVNSGSVYASAMINITTASATNSYFFHFGSGTSGFTAKVFAKADGGGYDLGITKSANTAVNFTSTLTYGTTYLIVIKYTFAAGSANDPCDLFLNPTPGSSEPAPTISAADPTATDFSHIDGIYLRQASGIPTAKIDGIKVGTTWADVTPASGPAATFTITGTLSAFSQTSATPSSEQIYNISGTGLSANVILVPPAGFEISKTSGSGFVNSSGSLIYTAAEVIAGKTIYVRLNAVTPGNYSGSITHTSAGSDFTPASQEVSGANTAKCILSLTALIEARYNNGTMEPDSVTVELHDASTYSLVDQDKELLSASGTGTFTFNSAINGTDYYIVIKHRNSIETCCPTAQSFTSFALNYNFTTSITQSYGNNLILKSGKYCIYSGDVNQDGFVTSDDFTGVDNDNSNFDYHLVNDINGDGFITSDDYTSIDNNGSNFVSILVPTATFPTLTATPNSLTDFSYNTGSGPSTSKSFSLSGINLSPSSGNITINGSTDYEVSNNSTTWGSSTTISYISSVLGSTTVFVRLKSGLSVGSYNSENVTISGGSASTINVICSGSVIAVPTLVSSPASLSSFSYYVGSGPSASQSYSLSGSNLTGAPGSITITGSTDYEVSNNNTTWGSSTTIGYSSSTLSSTPVYVRLKSGLSAGSYNSENITNSGGGASTINVSCSGTVNVIVSNVNLIMGNPSNATVNVNYPHNYLLDKPQFCASYDRDRAIANWTSWQLNSTWIIDNSTRNDPYRVDNTLPSGWPQVGSGYNYSTYGFDRGHLCPSADRTNTQENNDALFVMTNLIPQSSVNNQGVWASLETYERSLITAGNVVYIITGGYGTGGTSAIGTFNSIQSTSGVWATVPAKLWKVMIVIPNGTSTTSDISLVNTNTRTIAVIMNNDQGPFNSWQSYRVSVDDVEALTGYDFFSNVSPSIQAVIESRVDNQ